jgi:hypothetical protein
MSKPEVRPTNPLDDESTQPTPDEDTEIGKANKLAEENKKPPHAVDVEQEASSPKPKQSSR